MAHTSSLDDRDARPLSVGATIGSSMRGLDQASIMGVELMAAVVTWAGIGWLIDGWLGTAHWGLGIGALIGNAAGLYLVFLRANRMEGFRDLPSRSKVAASVGSNDGR